MVSNCSSIRIFTKKIYTHNFINLKNKINSFNDNLRSMPYNQSIDPKRDPSNNTCTTKNLDVWLHELKTEFEQYKQQQSLTNQSNLDKITNLEQENKSLKIRIDQLEKTDKTTPRAPPAPLSNPPQRTFSSRLFDVSIGKPTNLRTLSSPSKTSNPSRKPSATPES
jgi:hypothetical protein